MTYILQPCRKTIRGRGGTDFHESAGVKKKQTRSPPHARLQSIYHFNLRTLKVIEIKYANSVKAT